MQERGDWVVARENTMHRMAHTIEAALHVAVSYVFTTRLHAMGAVAWALSTPA